MAERAGPVARRPALAHTVVRVAGTAGAAAVLVFSALVYGAAHRQVPIGTSARAPAHAPAQVTPDGFAQTVPAPSPVTTRTS